MPVLGYDYGDAGEHSPDDRGASPDESPRPFLGAHGGGDRYRGGAVGAAAAGAEATYDVSAAIESIGFGYFQVSLMFMSSSIWIADAMEMMMLSFLTPALACQWGLTDSQKAMITTVVFIGMGCGAPFWGWFDDKYGRKKGYFASVILTAAAGLLSAASTGYPMLLCCRCVVGFGVSGSHVCVTLFSEFLPTAWRAWGVLMIGAFWAFGGLLEALLAWAVMPNYDQATGWRVLLVLSAIPLFLLLFLYPFMPESVRWDLLRGDPERAARTLALAADRNGSRLPPGQLVAARIADVPEESSSVRGLFSPEMRRTTVLLLQMWLAIAMTYYGVVLLNTELFQEEASGSRCPGTSPTPEAPTPEPQQCAMLTEHDYRDALVDAFAELPGLFACWLLIDNFGRRRTLAVGMGTAALCFFLLVFCWIRTVENLWIFGCRGALGGVFQVVYLYTPEVYPTAYRARALGMCSSFARLGGMLTPFISEVVMPFSSRLALGFYAAMCAAAAAAAMALSVETAGQELRETVYCSALMSPATRPSDAPDPGIPPAAALHRQAEPRLAFRPSEAFEAHTPPAAADAATAAAAAALQSPPAPAERVDI